MYVYLQHSFCTFSRQIGGGIYSLSASLIVHEPIKGNYDIGDSRKNVERIS